MSLLCLNHIERLQIITLYTLYDAESIEKSNILSWLIFSIIIHNGLLNKTWCNHSFCFLLFYQISSALSIFWHDSKWAIHLVPKTSCREGNDEAKKKSRDTQVESPIEWPLSPSVCCGFTSSFNSFQVFFSHLSSLIIYRLSWLICSHAWWRSVLFSQQFSFFLFCVVFPVRCCWLFVCCGTRLVFLLSHLDFFLAGELMFHQVLLRNTLNFLRRWKAQRMALTRWLNILTYEVYWNKTTSNKWESQMPLDCTL